MKGAIMMGVMRWMSVAAVVVLWQAVAGASEGDWPQWRGPNRDAKAAFEAPAKWPDELTKKWSLTVGEGDATPALVGDRLYVFSRDEGTEITRCLDAGSGKELWQDRYDALGATGPASRHAGPRSSPTVAQGKVVTLGVRGTLSCIDAASGKLEWRHDDFKGEWPRFFTSSSPIVVGGVCIAQLGGGDDGAMVAYDFASGAEKWRWSGDGTAYASPVLLTVDGEKVIVALTEKSVVCLNPADGKLLWQTAYPPARRSYNSATPVVDGSTIIYSGSGRGTRAVRLKKGGDGLTANELWNNADTAVQFNSPVLKDGLLFGLTDRDNLFCLNAKTGQTAWTAPGGGQRGFGSIVDAGSVLVALTPAAQLIVFEPSATGYQKVASYQVSDGEIYAYPVLSGKRIYIKDADSVTLWTAE